MIHVTLPDGSLKELPPGSSAMDLAKAISPALADAVVVARVNGEICDLQDPLPAKCKIELIKPDTPEGIDTLRHSAEHLLATAVCRLFPGAQVTMGPRNHDGEFYYDFDVGRPFTPDDLAAIEKEMTNLVKERVAFKKSLVTKPEAKALFDKLGQKYKPEIIDWIPDDLVSIYQNADFIDLCRGPHVPHAGFVKAFKLLSVSGSYWRADSSREMLQRINGIAFSNTKDLETYLHRAEEAKKRDHRKLGAALELFSVSERADSHDYLESEEVEISVSGSVRRNAHFDLGDNAINAIRSIFAPRKVALNGYSLSSHGEENPLAFDVQLKIFTSSPSKEQRQELAKLEKTLVEHHHLGRVRLTIETKYVEEIGPGLVTWLPKGAIVRDLVEGLLKKWLAEDGYDQVVTPHIAKSDLWKVSGHWFFYKDGMFSPMNVDGQEYVAKPMNCPGHIMVYKNRPRSYRDLPIRLAELGTVYRYELAGVMHGLMRVRGFSQDDAHLFCRWDQFDEEADKIIRFVRKLMKTFGFEKFEVNLSTRPEKYVGDLEKWNHAEAALLSAIKRNDLPYQVDEGGGAFYGPKIDIKLRDCLDRLWQCSTIQLDFNNPQRFNLVFTNSEGQPEQPVMIHRAVLGSMERFIGILIEQYAGAFPMWLAPEQVRILSVADRHLEHGRTVLTALKKLGLRAHMPEQSDKLGAKIRQAQMDKVPLMIIVGDKEAEQNGGTIRLRSGEDQGFMPLTQLAEYCETAARLPAI